MEVAVRRNAAGAITSVDVVVARFCMLYLANVPPKDFVTTIQSTNNTKHYSRGGKTAMSEEELGYVRYHIQSMVHPCTSLNNNIVWGVHEHAGHLKCFSPTPLIFILSDKEAAMRDLRSLGCDIEKEYVQRLARVIQAAVADNLLAFAVAISMIFASSTQPIWPDVKRKVELLRLEVYLPRLQGASDSQLSMRF